MAFPQQQWLHERASLLSYTYFACLVLYLTLILVLRFFYVDPLFYTIFPYSTFHLIFRLGLICGVEQFSFA